MGGKLAVVATEAVMVGGAGGAMAVTVGAAVEAVTLVPLAVTDVDVTAGPEDVVG